MNRLNLDFETFSKADIKVVGAHRYAMDPSTEVICLGYAFEDEEPELWIAGDPMPEELFYCIERGDLAYAWNTTFEYVIWKYVCVDRMDWIEVPFMSWRDTQAIASNFALPLSLGKCGAALNLPIQKQKRGEYLIRKLSKPQKPTKKDPYKRWTVETHPELFEEFYSYCLDDVRSEREILKSLPWEIYGDELNIWRETLIKNNRGIPIDIELVNNIVMKIEEYLEEITSMIPIITGGSVDTINQRAKIMEWCELQGYELPDFTADTVEKCLKDPEIEKYPNVKNILDIRTMAGKSSIKKFKKIQQAICDDNRIRDCLKYHKATTGREGGRLLQPQNLPRAEVDDTEQAIKLFKRGTLEDVLSVYDNVLYSASALIRPSIWAPKGKKFLVSDYSSIENRMVCWLAGQNDILDKLENGLCLYTDMASDLYSIPYDQIPKDSEMRRHGKLTVLGCISEGTPVLTDSGFKPIEKITLEDKLFDGYNYVSHDGVISKGPKLCNDLNLTDDHKVLTPNFWMESCQLKENTEYLNQAKTLAASLLLKNLIRKAEGTTKRSVKIVMKLKHLLLQIFTEVFQKNVNHVQIQIVQINIMKILDWTQSIVGVLDIGLEMPIKDARTIITQNMKTMEVEELNSILMKIIYEKLYYIYQYYQDSESRIYKLIELIMIGIMKREILDLPHLNNKQTIKETYDILNVGNLNRFMIITKDNPLIVHNCGYMMGWKTFKSDCEGRGFILTENEAKRTIKVFRKKYDLVKELWYGLKDAAENATVNHGQIFSYGKIQFYHDKGYLFMVLPNGKCLAYPNARLEETKAPWGWTTAVVHDGEMSRTKKWGRVSLSPGRLTENASQAASREVLMEAQLDVEREGYTVILTVHDELVIEVDEDFGSIDELNKIMCNRSDVYEGLPLKAAGFETKRYRK